MTQRAIVEFGVDTVMRDGTVLRADVFRPDVAAPVPVILLRNPYFPIVARRALDQFRAVEMGFAVVAQSVRGTGRSEGVFEPWRWDTVDGADSVAWCAAQPWSNGRVGMYGMSYLAHTQLFAAAGHPAALRAITPTVVPSHPYDLTYRGGALLLASAQGWSVMQAGTRILRGVSAGAVAPDAIAAWQAAAASTHTLAAGPPRGVALLAEHFPPWAEWLDHPVDDEWWAQVRVGDRGAVPGLYTAGWWDLFLEGTIAEFLREPTHPDSRLVIGPWSHMLDGGAHGEVNYGAGASVQSLDLEGERLAFLRRHLVEDAASAGLNAATDAPARVRVFVMGENRWRSAATWPLPEAREQRWGLHAGGRLSPSAPDPDAAPLTFVFDPHDPCPTMGGANLYQGSEGAYRTGPCEQSPLDGRRDVLHFTSEPLSAPVTVIGHVQVLLHASTSAVDTDWTAKLIDVWPDGRAFNVADGILRMRHRDTNTEARLLPAGSVQHCIVDVGAIAQRFDAGHRIRIDVSSSNAPRYDVNPGTGATAADTDPAVWVTAQQHVFVDAQRASWLVLPVVDA